MALFFERLNFFKGLFVQAEDWQKEQLYHIEKRRFHNKYLHTPGVAFGCLGDLKVTVNADGTALEIAPGYAIDGEGHDLYLPEKRILEIPALSSFNPPITIFITIRWNKREEDMRVNDANPQYSGYAYITEDSIIELSPKEPDNHIRIELGRVTLSADAAHIKNAIEPFDPQTDELNLTNVPGAGARAGTQRKEYTLHDLGVKVMDATIQVRGSEKKEDDTNVLIERVAKDIPPPMYIVHVQSMDDSPVQWWIECSPQEEAVEYILHIKNLSSTDTTAVSRVFRMKI